MKPTTTTAEEAIRNLAGNNSAPPTPEAKKEPANWRAMFHTRDELLNAPPLTFAIRDFWQNDAINLIGGLSGHMKTFLALSMAKALLGDKPLWNHFAVTERAVRVLYLIPESAVGPFAHRLKLFGLLKYCADDDDRLLVRTLSKGPAPRLDDAGLLFACKGAHVFLDTAVRFAEEMDDENSARQSNQFASMLFDLLNAGARSVGGLHHSAKAFANQSIMTLENVLRGSGDIGAMVATAWGVKQINKEQSIVHVECIKARDFQPPLPFQLKGRPFIDEKGDFEMFKKPGDCGSLVDEQPEGNKGGAPEHKRKAKAANLALLKVWQKDGEVPAPELRKLFAAEGIKLSDETIRGYKSQLKKGAKA